MLPLFKLMIFRLRKNTQTQPASHQLFRSRCLCHFGTARTVAMGGKVSSLAGLNVGNLGNLGHGQVASFDLPLRKKKKKTNPAGFILKSQQQQQQQQQQQTQTQTQTQQHLADHVRYVIVLICVFSHCWRLRQTFVITPVAAKKKMTEVMHLPTHDAANHPAWHCIS